MEYSSDLIKKVLDALETAKSCSDKKCQTCAKHLIDIIGTIVTRPSLADFDCLCRLIDTLTRTYSADDSKAISDRFYEVKRLYDTYRSVSLGRGDYTLWLENKLMTIYDSILKLVESELPLGDGMCNLCGSSSRDWRRHSCVWGTALSYLEQISSAIRRANWATQLDGLRKHIAEKESST